MTPEEWAAAMHSLATNDELSMEQRLTAALQALDFYTREEHRARVRTLGEKVAAETAEVLDRLAIVDTAPGAWKDLIIGLNLLVKHATSEVSPFHYEHDELWIMSDPHKFTKEELALLDKLGFFVTGHDIDDSDGDEGQGFAWDCKDKDCEAGFKSYRFGSA